MFEVHDLKIPSQVVFAAATTATSSPNLWLARLGHPSLSRLDVVHTLLISASLPERF